MIEEFNRRARDVKTEEERTKLYDELTASVKLPPTSISKVADQIDYVRRVAGVESVGIGSDFDGNTAWPVGLSDVSKSELPQSVRGAHSPRLDGQGTENACRRECAASVGVGQKVSAEMKRQ